MPKLKNPKWKILKIENALLQITGDLLEPIRKRISEIEDKQLK